MKALTYEVFVPWLVLSHLERILIIAELLGRMAWLPPQTEEKKWHLKEPSCPQICDFSRSKSLALIGTLLQLVSEQRSLRILRLL